MKLASERRREIELWLLLIFALPICAAFGALLGWLFMHPELMK